MACNSITEAYAHYVGFDMAPVVPSLADLLNEAAAALERPVHMLVLSPVCLVDSLCGLQQAGIKVTVSSFPKQRLTALIRMGTTQLVPCD